MRRVVTGAVVALGVMCAGTAAASAHPLLAGASPQPGLVAPKSPAAIVVGLSEPAVARGSAITLTDTQGRKVPLGHVRTTSGARTITATVPSRLASAVYSVRWQALGDDGHSVSGTFSFGVAGAHGRPPPGASTLAGGGSGGRGSENAAVDGPVRVAARWLGLVAAALLFGGALLVRRVAGAGPVIRRFLPLTWGAIALAAAVDVLVEAASGPGGGLDAGLVSGSPSGRVAFARLVLALVAVDAVLVLRRSPRRLAISGVAAAGVLLSYGAEGHLLALHGGQFALVLIVQSLHVLAAGAWLGGLLLLACARGRFDLRDAARRFAPVAAAGVMVAGVTGIVLATRLVEHWYFLRWSDYGRVVIVKSALFVVVVAAGALTAFVARRGRPRSWLVRGEAVALVLVIALAAALGGLAQGRGQPLPAQRGALLPGPAIATAVMPAGNARVLLAPARAGANTLTVSSDIPARTVTARLVCGCSKRPLQTTLTRHADGAPLSTRVDLPADGAWYATLAVDSKNAPAPLLLTVGAPRAPGADPVTLLSVADLSGPDGDRCRDHLLGLELAVGRLNADGGLDGGRKVVPLVLDSGGSGARAGALARAAIKQSHPVAVAGACGSGAEVAIAAAGAAGVPSVVADPAVAPVVARNSYRLAADPYAEGIATGQYLRRVVEPAAAHGARTVRLEVADDVSGRRLRSGLTAALRGSGLRTNDVALSARNARGADDAAHVLAIVVDTPDTAPVAAALKQAGGKALDYPAAPVIASERVMDERFIQASGTLGRTGVVRGPSEVATEARDAIAYAGALPLLYSGERPSLEGLRGYAGGLALLDGVKHGSAPGAIDARLRRPAPFTDALLSPWRSDVPGVGSQRLAFLAPSFLPSGLIPTSAGGEAYSGRFFPDGTWTRLETDAYGPSLRAAPPPLSAGPNGTRRG